MSPMATFGTMRFYTTTASSKRLLKDVFECRYFGNCTRVCHAKDRVTTKLLSTCCPCFRKDAMLAQREEIALFRKCSDVYGYVFYVLRLRAHRQRDVPAAILLRQMTHNSPAKTS
jgi:hypothetical protein